MVAVVVAVVIKSGSELVKIVLVEAAGDELEEMEVVTVLIDMLGVGVDVDTGLW